VSNALCNSSPVVADGKREPAVEELQGLFRARGETPKVAAVEREGGRIYMVRDHGVWPSLRSTGRVIDRRDRKLRRVSMAELSRVIQEARVSEEIPPQKDRFYLVVPNPTNPRLIKVRLCIYPSYVHKSI